MSRCQSANDRSTVTDVSTWLGSRDVQAAATRRRSSVGRDTYAAQYEQQVIATCLYLSAWESEAHALKGWGLLRGSTVHVAAFCCVCFSLVRSIMPQENNAN